MEPKLTDTAVGEPDGPVTVAPVSDDVTELSFSAERRAGDVFGDRNRSRGGVASRSAVESVGGRGRWCRSACRALGNHLLQAGLGAAAVEDSLAEATDGVLIALPENMKRSPAWVLRIPTIDDSSVSAFCCPMVWPVLLRSCGVDGRVALHRGR